MSEWSNWMPFPDPRTGQYIYAPFGPGVYELRRISTNEKILAGKGSNTAFRMSSLLPEPYGCGTRKNERKREYTLEHISDIEYRTIAFERIQFAEAFEKELLWKFQYLFHT